MPTKKNNKKDEKIEPANPSPVLMPARLKHKNEEDLDELIEKLERSPDDAFS